MWYGKMTPELEDLYDKYYAIFESDPDEYIDLEYGQDEYDGYVNDIKKAIDEKRELPDFVE